MKRNPTVGARFRDHFLHGLAGRIGLCVALVTCAVARTGAATDSAPDPRTSARTHARVEEVQIRAGEPLIVRGRTEATLRVKPGAYLQPPYGTDGAQGVILIEKSSKIVLDLTDVYLRGTPPSVGLDALRGYGIVLRECEDVTIKGGRLGGFHSCIVARDCRGLTLDGIVFDGWYGMHLLSTAAAEDESDWLFPHENDKDEWLTKYGAAISLNDCSKAIVKGCAGRHGQNGILLTRSNDTQVFDCDFSFLSGWGLALYRASRNVVSHNSFDFCVRGYSHEVYWRGQDSAGILMFERCSDNLFAENSATHGGDGVFLFAGQDTVEGRALARGESDAGGCDRNIWHRNDFSYAVANAIEATFSNSNWAIDNELDGSHQHGVWGGYSSAMVIWKNRIRSTLGGGVSIEHGQECVIAENEFRDDDMALELWWDEDPGLVGGPFGQHHDTSSRDHFVLGNSFAENATDFVLTKSTGLSFAGNEFASTTSKLNASGLEFAGEPVRGKQPMDLLVGRDGTKPSGRVKDVTVRAFDGKDPSALAQAKAWKCPALPGTRDVRAHAAAEAGLDKIVMGEWGPWDLRAKEPRPKQRLPGGLLADSRWKATWFSWKDRVDPRTDAVAWRALQFAPLARSETGVWSNPWAGDAEVQKTVGTDHFGLIARSTVKLEKGGTFRLSTVSDDGLRVLVDGKPAIENWTWHAPTRDVAELLLAAGEHEFVLEYFQIDGAYALSIELVAR